MIADPIIRPLGCEMERFVASSMIHMYIKLRPSTYDMIEAFFSRKVSQGLGPNPTERGWTLVHLTSYITCNWHVSSFGLSNNNEYLKPVRLPSNHNFQICNLQELIIYTWFVFGLFFYLFIVFEIILSIILSILRLSDLLCLFYKSVYAIIYKNL